MNKNSTGIQRLSNPRLNKGTAFTSEERKRYKLDGLLPHQVSSMQQQLEKNLANFRSKSNDIEKYIFLNALHRRNERLYFRLLIDNIDEMMPIVYTPTVGQACQKFASIFRETSGFYISLEDKGNIDQLLENWPEPDVRLIVVTDGERILGLGDLGTNGMGIPIGKLALYCACAGVKPEQCMPIMLDVGTENEKLRNENLYLGSRRTRARGAEYDDFVDEFIQAIKLRYPKAILQFEDFATPNAIALLQRYKHQLLCFNDDIQGTAAVALAGLFAATRLTKARLTEKRFMFVGAGSAASGIGILLQVALEKAGLASHAARDAISFVDYDGLLTQGRKNLPAHVMDYVKSMPNMSLLDAVKTIKPHVIIGATGAPGIFSSDVIRAMADNHEQPIIFALSNPTAHAECTAEDAYLNSDGRAIFASGSPFGPVFVNGAYKIPGQGNNAYIFPGLGLGALLGQIKEINDELLICAAHTLAECVSENQLVQGCLYPPLSEIRDVSFKIALAVMREAKNLDLLGPEMSQQEEEQDFETILINYVYDPYY